MRSERERTTGDVAQRHQPRGRRWVVRDERDQRERRARTARSLWRQQATRATREKKLSPRLPLPLGHHSERFLLPRGDPATQRWPTKVRRLRNMMSGLPSCSRTHKLRYRRLRSLMGLIAFADTKKRKSESVADVQQRTDFLIKPESVTPALDCSQWPLLLKVRLVSHPSRCTPSWLTGPVSAH